jgi:hypothetical protein
VLLRSWSGSASDGPTNLTLVRPLLALGRAMWAPSASPSATRPRLNVPYITNDGPGGPGRSVLASALHPWLEWMMGYLSPAWDGKAPAGVDALLGPSALDVTIEVVQACGQLLAVGVSGGVDVVRLATSAMSLLSAVVAGAKPLEPGPCALAACILKDVVRWVRGGGPMGGREGVLD